MVFGMFSIQLKQQNKFITESYYELEPEIENTEYKLKEMEDFKNVSTNKAFNEDKEFKEIMRNFKTVSANDFERTTKTLEVAKTSKVKEETSLNKSYTNSNVYALNSEETRFYKKLQNELNKRLKNKKIADEHANLKSTLTYSLKGRTLTYYKTPRYLCEIGGKIVVSIKVDNAGNVYKAFINGASNSSNQCLIDHAIEYAKSVQFNNSGRKNQLGTITFLFSGKR